MGLALHESFAMRYGECSFGLSCGKRKQRPLAVPCIRFGPWAGLASCTNRLPCDMANARWVSRAGSGSSALLRCPASASALGRASRLADRCAKNFSLFLPLAAVEILALHAAQCHASDDELREQQVDDDHGQDGDGDHHIHLAHIELQEVCTAQLCDQDGQGLLIGGIQD